MELGDTGVAKWKSRQLTTGVVLILVFHQNEVVIDGRNSKVRMLHSTGRLPSLFPKRVRLLYHRPSTIPPVLFFVPLYTYCYSDSSRSNPHHAACGFLPYTTYLTESSVKSSKRKSDDQDLQRRVRMDFWILHFLLHLRQENSQFLSRPSKYPREDSQADRLQPAMVILKLHATKPSIKFMRLYQ